MILFYSLPYLFSTVFTIYCLQHDRKGRPDVFIGPPLYACSVMKMRSQAPRKLFDPSGPVLALQAAVDQMMKDAKNEMVASFQNQAFSEDGKTFTCYIANSEYNEYDMFIALYTEISNDAEPLYLSGLMRPGEAFREIALDEALDKGTHDVYSKNS